MVYQFHSLCVPVGGFFRTAIYDLQFGCFYLCEHSVNNSLRGNSDELLISRLKANNLVYSGNGKGAQLKSISVNDYSYPGLISNLIVEVKTAVDFELIFRIVNECLCYNLQIVIIGCEITKRDIEDLIRLINTSIVKHCEIVLPFDVFDEIGSLLNQVLFPELHVMYVYNMPLYNQHDAHYKFPITFIYGDYSYSAGQNIKSISGFSVNSLFYVESSSFNTYYNRKLFIGLNGEIGNGPLSMKSFGNLKTIGSVEKLLRSKKFMKLWHVKKDDISVCNVCEFRHMCLDSRVPIEHKIKGKYYHQTECNYNPFIAKWEGEAGYQSLAECGIFVTSEKIHIDYKKLYEITRKIYIVD